MKNEITLGTAIIIAGGAYYVGYKRGCQKTCEVIKDRISEALIDVLKKVAEDNQDSKGE